MYGIFFCEIDVKITYRMIVNKILNFDFIELFLGIKQIKTPGSLMTNFYGVLHFWLSRF